MTALVLAQIPDPHISTTVAADQLALIWVNNHVVHRHPMRVVPLDVATSSVPDLDCTVFARGDQPFRLAVEGNASHVAGVTVEGEDGIWVGRFDVVELYGVVPGGGEVALVGGDAEAVDLRVWVWDRARADAGEGFPEAGRGQSGLCRGRIAADRMVWS